MPDKEIWYSELGWDTNPYSPQAAPSLEAQGQWLVRGFLISLGAGVDRVQMYMLRDINPNSSGKYSSCGLVGIKGDWTPKPSWYYVYTVRNVLEGMVFDAILPSGNPDAWVYRFRSLTGGNYAYALWCPTSNGTIVNGYSLALDGSPGTAAQISMEEGDINGVAASLSIQNGSVSVFKPVNDITTMLTGLNIFRNRVQGTGMEEISKLQAIYRGLFFADCAPVPGQGSEE